MRDVFDVIIVGGGMWGLSTAYHLATADPGLSIVVLERNSELADETTRQSAGQIGQLRASPVMARGVAYTLQFFATFKEVTGHDPHFERPGSLHLALNSKRAAAFVRLREQAASLGIEVNHIAADDIEHIASTVRRDFVESALHLPGDGFVDARVAALAISRAAEAAGVEIRCGETVNRLIVEKGRVAGIETKSGPLHTESAVFTAGPWTRVLAEHCGIRLPVVPIRLQQSRTVADPDRPSNHPVLRIPDHSSYLRPEKQGYLFGRLDDEATPIDSLDDSTHTADIKSSDELVSEARQRLSSVIPVLGSLATEEYRQGMVTCSPDGKYLLGPISEIPGLWLGTGCGAMGIAGSAAVGHWLAEWIVRNDPGEDLSQFSPLRFAELTKKPLELREACRNVFRNYYSMGSGGTTYGDLPPAAN